MLEKPTPAHHTNQVVVPDCHRLLPVPHPDVQDYV
eukprot:Gb_28447 [translate_table: standard]